MNENTDISISMKALKRRVSCGNVTERDGTVEASRQEPAEDHLGAAPIRPGDSVIVIMKWF